MSAIRPTEKKRDERGGEESIGSSNECHVMSRERKREITMRRSHRKKSRGE
jgi:hypothetical protein